MCFWFSKFSENVKLNKDNNNFAFYKIFILLMDNWEIFFSLFYGYKV